MDGQGRRPLEACLQQAGNFCEKHPDTAELIEGYLNKILPLLEEVATKSEILNDGHKTIVPEVSEGACRPLISERSPEVRKQAIHQIVKAAEDKLIDGKKPQVTGKEVAEIVRGIKKEVSKSEVLEPEKNAIRELPRQRDSRT